MLEKLKKSKHYPLVILCTLILIWGSSFILIKKGLDGFDPIHYVSIRLAMTGLMFLPFLIKRFKKIDWSLWPYILMVGYIGALIPFCLYGYAQTKVTSSVAGMINSMTPIFTFIIGVLFFRSGFRWLQFLGILLGLSGAGLLIFNEAQSVNEVNILSGLLMVIATIMYGFNANVVNTQLRKLHPLDLSSSSFVMASIPCFFYIFIPEHFHHMTHNPAAIKSLGYITLLVIFGTVIATLLFFKLVQITNAVFGTLVAYFLPIVAIFWGLVDGEPFTLIHVGGIALILFGVYMIRKNDVTLNPKK